MKIDTLATLTNKLDILSQKQAALEQKIQVMTQSLSSNHDRFTTKLDSLEVLSYCQTASVLLSLTAFHHRPE